MHRIELLLSLILLGCLATEVRQPVRAQQKEKPVSKAASRTTLPASTASAQQPKSTASKAASSKQPKSTASKAASSREPKSAASKAASAQQPKSTASKAASSREPKSAASKAASSREPKSAASKAASSQPPKSAASKAASSREPKSRASAPAWLTIKEASASAKQKNRLILADFFTDSCVWCKAMDAKTLQDASVKSYLSSNFVCMKVNASDGADGQGLAIRHQINNFPTFAIFRANGHLMAKFEGYRDPEQFISAIEEIRSRLKI